MRHRLTWPLHDGRVAWHRATTSWRGRANANASSATIPGPDSSGLTSTSMPMTTPSPTRLLHPTPLRVATVTLCLMLGGCTVVGDWFGSASTDYKGASKRTQPLEVPPDLTQLQRDSRYLPQGGVVAASDLSKPGTPAAAAPAAVVASPEVALAAAGNLHIERAGDRRWLSTSDAPEKVLPKVRDYWLANGFKLIVDEPKTGILETDWKQKTTRMPGGMITNFLNSIVDSLSDSGFRDRYRTRIERRADGGTEIYLTHFGAAEETTGKQTSTQDIDVKWVARPADPGMEAEQLSRLMLALAGVDDTNLAVVKSADAQDASASGPSRNVPSAILPATGTGANGAARARIVTGQPGATLQVDDNFDRSWRRIGLALDHGGFTVEDRDRAQGLYYVRFTDAKEAAREEPGFFSKITSFFGANNASPVGKYRISIKAPADTATISVLNDQGQPDNSENAQRIVGLLLDELK